MFYHFLLYNKYYHPKSIHPPTRVVMFRMEKIEMFLLYKTYNSSSRIHIQRNSTMTNNEQHQKFLADCEQCWKDPTYRAELKTIDQHLGRTDPRYPTTPDEVQRWFAEHNAIQAAKAAEAEKAEKEEQEELARQLAIQEHIFSYPDGSVYMGHMRDGVTRHGRGTLRTPAFVYGEMKNYTSDEAAENAHLAKWHEYAGNWENDKLHGYGVHVRKSGDGGEILIFEGIWDNGKPTKAVDADHDGAGEENDVSSFDW